MEVGVVRRGELEVLEEQPSRVQAFALERVGDGRVAVELHADLQAVVEDGRDEGPLVGEGGLLFDERGERHRVPDAQAQFGGPPAAGVVEDHMETGDHGRDDVRLRGPAGQVVGVREEVSLEVAGPGVQVGDEPGVEAGPAEGGPAFGVGRPEERRDLPGRSALRAR